MADPKKDLNVRVSYDIVVSAAEVKRLQEELKRVNAEVNRVNKSLDAAQKANLPQHKITGLEYKRSDIQAEQTKLGIELARILRIRERLIEQMERPSETIRDDINQQIRAIRRLRIEYDEWIKDVERHQKPRVDFRYNQEGFLNDQEVLKKARQQAREEDIDAKIQRVIESSKIGTPTKRRYPPADAEKLRLGTVDVNKVNLPGVEGEYEKFENVFDKTMQQLIETLQNSVTAIQQEIKDKQALIQQKRKEHDEIVFNIKAGESSVENNKKALETITEVVALNKQLDELYVQEKKGKQELARAKRRENKRLAQAKLAADQEVQVSGSGRVRQEVYTNYPVGTPVSDEPPEFQQNIDTAIAKAERLHQLVLKSEEELVQAEQIVNDFAKSLGAVGRQSSAFEELAKGAKEAGEALERAKQNNLELNAAAQQADDAVVKEINTLRAFRDAVKAENIRKETTELAQSEAWDSARTEDKPRAEKEVAAVKKLKTEAQEAQEAVAKLEEQFSKFSNTVRSRGQFVMRAMKSFNLDIKDALNVRQRDPADPKKLLEPLTDEMKREIVEYIKLIQKHVIDARDELNKAVKNVPIRNKDTGKVTGKKVVPPTPSIIEGQTVFSDVVVQRGQQIYKLMKDMGVSYSEAVKAAIGSVSPEVEKQAKLWVAVAKAEDKATVEARKYGEAGGPNDPNKPKKFNPNAGSFSEAFAGFELRFAGQQMINAAKQIVLPMQQFAQYAGQANRISSEWLNTQTELSNAMASMGESLAEVALPTLKNISSVIKDIAVFFKENKWVANIGVVFAGGTWVLGQIAALSGTMMTSLAAFKYVVPMLTGLANSPLFVQNAKGLIVQAAGAAGQQVVNTGETVAMGATIKALIPNIIRTALPLILAAGVVSLIVAAVAREDQRIRDANTQIYIPNQTAQVIAEQAQPSIGQLLSQSRENQFWKIMTAPRITAENASKRQASQEKPGDSAIQAYIQFTKQMQDEEEQYGENRLKIIEDYNASALAAEKEYKKKVADLDEEQAKIIADATDEALDAAKNRTNAMEEYALSEKRATEDYYRDRLLASRDYNIDVQRAEEDHQRKMRQMQEDHDLKVLDLLFENDAFGLLAEQRSYEKERRQAEEEYRVDASRRSEDFALRLKDMEDEFRIERERAAEDFQRRLQDEDAQKKIEKERKLRDLEKERKELEEERKADREAAMKERDKQLIDLQNAHIKTQNALRAAFSDQLRDLNIALLNEQKIKQEYYSAMQTDLITWLGNMQGAFPSELPGYPQKASGGYLTDGIYRAGEAGDEFLLSHNTTKYMEYAVGGKLTQDSFRGFGRGGSVTLNQNFRFEGSLTTEEKRQLRRMAREETQIGISKVLGVA